MRNFGNDKPDLRFDMQLKNLKVKKQVEASVLNEVAFKVFEDAETIIAISVPGASEYTRKQTDELTEWVKRPQIGMSGLVFVKYNTDGTFKSSVDKFFTPEQLAALATHCDSKSGDLLLIVAGNEARTRKAASELRLEMGNRLGLRNPDEYRPLWVIDFPLFEHDEEGNRWVARHHPFTAPKPDQISVMIENDPKIENAAEYYQHPYNDIKANAYDLVLNGTEIGGGSIRIYQRDLQEKMFAALGMTQEEAQEKFGFLLGAFEYGAPPHGGIAWGLDRLCALLGGQETIRDFIAFPKNNSGRDVMLDAPSEIDKNAMKELGM
jgi:aspartyl-tRNA synthetase